MRVRRLLLAWGFLALACTVACATLAGINDGNGSASSSGETGLPVRDGGALSDRGSDPDALASCPPSGVTTSLSQLHASKVALDAPVTINGDPAEWACVDRLDFSTGGRVVGSAAGHDIAEIAMQWDDQHLYLLARVTTDSPGGTGMGDQIFKNDSVHLFLAGPDPQPGAGYRPSDHQIVIDYQSLVADYGGGLTRSGVNGIAASAGTFKSQNGVLTFAVEARRRGDRRTFAGLQNGRARARELPDQRQRDGQLSHLVLGERDLQGVRHVRHGRREPPVLRPALLGGSRASLAERDVPPRHFVGGGGGGGGGG